MCSNSNNFENDKTFIHMLEIFNNSCQHIFYFYALINISITIIIFHPRHIPHDNDHWIISRYFRNIRCIYDSRSEIRALNSEKFKSNIFLRKYGNKIYEYKFLCIWVSVLCFKPNVPWNTKKVTLWFVVRKWLNVHYTNGIMKRKM